MTLILLPGMMCDARLWGPQAMALDAQVLPLPPRDTMGAMAADLLAQMPDRFALAGLSMGGILAMEITRQSPDRVERLALLDTNPLAETAAVQARRPAQIARAEAGDLAGVMRDEMMPHYLAPGSDPAILDLCLDMALSLGPEVFASSSRALAARPDQCATLAAFTGPALVLTGEHDRLCRRDKHDLMYRLMPQSRLVVIEGAGHLPTLEKPNETTAALRRWLEE